MKKIPQVSEFARSLRTLIDDTHVLSRKDWANVLGVSPAAISQWVRDKTIPSPENLRQILQLVRRLDGVPKDILLGFDELAARPASQVSPHGHRMGRSIAEYLVSPVLSGFVSRFVASVRALPTLQQEKFLNYAMEKLPDWIGLAMDNALIDVRQRYPERTRIAIKDLDDIFEKPNWTTLHVIASRPHELYEDDNESVAFFRTQTEHFLRRADRTLSYVSPLIETRAKASKLLRDSNGTVKYLHKQRTAFKELMELAATKCGGGETRASHLIVFDLALEKAYGYAWFDNYRRGSILTRDVVHHIRTEIEPIERASGLVVGGRQTA